MKKHLLFLLMCFIIFPSVTTFDCSSAAKTEKVYITISVGQTKKVTLPKKSGLKNYYSSADSNAKVSSFGKKGSRTFTIKGVSATSKKKPSTVTVTTTSGKKISYIVTVKKATSGSQNSVGVSKLSSSVSGTCPQCKKSGKLQNVTHTYTRPAVTTGYLKEPIMSATRHYNMTLSTGVTEKQFEDYVESLGGIVYLSWYSNEYRKNYYNIVLPLDGVIPYDSSITPGGGYSTAYGTYYLSEVILEEVEAEPAKSVTLNTGLVKCTSCGYIYKK